MNDNLPTVWPAEPHTLAKHGILKRYLQAWMAILSQQSVKVPSGSKSILYVDGFAGPGIYEGDEPGSPIVAIRTALEHQGTLPVPVRFLFIELDPARFASLQQQVAALHSMVQTSPKVAGAEARQGDCTTVLSAIVAKPDQLGGKFGPAMVFLDQFGYSQIPITLIASIMQWPQCEVLSYLNWDHLNQYLSDANKADGITRAFGDDEWRKAIPMAGEERKPFLLGLYREALQKRGGAKYVLDFAMYDKYDSLIYWLFFSTNHLRGLEEMKKAMWKFGEGGAFRFSDRDQPGQMLLLSTLDEQWLADELHRRLAGRTLSVQEVKDFVLTDTPCYLFRGGLKLLESKKLAVPMENRLARKPCTYPPEHMDLKMKFATLGLFGG